MLSTKFFILITILVTVETIGMAFIKEFHICTKNGEKHKALKYYLLGVSLYALVCYILHMLFYYAPMYVTNCVWNAMSVILVIIVGVVVFNENFTIHDGTAALFVIIAILIFEYTNHSDNFENISMKKN